MAESQAVRGIVFAVRFRIIGKYLGQASLMLAALTCVPALVAFLGGSSEAALYYLAVIGGFALYGLTTVRISVPANMQKNEALVITALVFTVSSVAMAVPMLAYDIAFIDAWFEAVSGVTTTGLSVLDGVEDKPTAFLFGRAWIQWVGGLGVLVLVLALLMEPGLAAKRLGFGEREDIAGGTRTHARRVALVYTLITVAGILLLLVIGESVIDAVAHTFAAVSTGGFSNYDDSMAGIVSWPARVVITLLSIAGAISFSWYYLGYYKRISTLLLDPQFRGLIILCGITVAALFGFLTLGNPDRIVDNLVHATLTGISAQTTAGFASLTLSDLDPASKLVLTTSMLIGGELGSTAGGLKVLRLMILLSLVHLVIQRTAFPPTGRTGATVGGAALGSDEINVVVVLLVLYLLVVLLSWLVFVSFGYPPIDSLFEVVSAVGNAGLSVGITSASLDPALKTVLCLDMLMGRVEILAFMVLVYPRTWIGRRKG